jgi:hypothetical protein
MWGVRDKRTITDYGGNILGVRQAVPALLDLFAAREIACTWATVGFLFCADKDGLMASLPARLPADADSRLSPYDDLAAVGHDEQKDPYHFGLSLLRQVQNAPRQEIATHTFSHFYCLEEGSDLEAFRADLVAVKQVAERRGLPISSIAFPRNQMSGAHLHVCRELGLTAFRGNEQAWFHRAPSAWPTATCRSAARTIRCRSWSTVWSMSRRAAFCSRHVGQRRSSGFVSSASRRHGAGGAPRQNFSPVVASAQFRRRPRSQSGFSDGDPRSFPLIAGSLWHACQNHGGNRERKSQRTATGWYCSRLKAAQGESRQTFSAAIFPR